MKKTKFTGIREFIDTTNGEVVSMSTHNIETSGRKNFYICYMYNLMKLIDAFGGKKYELLKFIISNMDNDNKLFMTIAEIHSATKISIQTITDTIKILQDNDLIVHKAGYIMLNPMLFNRASPEKERYMLIKYCKLKRNKNSPNF